jgi:hypothetical protein
MVPNSLCFLSHYSFLPRWAYPPKPAKREAGKKSRKPPNMKSLQKQYKVVNRIPSPFDVWPCSNHAYETSRFNQTHKPSQSNRTDVLPRSDRTNKLSCSSRTNAPPSSSYGSEPSNSSHTRAVLVLGSYCRIGNPCAQNNMKLGSPPPRMKVGKKSMPIRSPSPIIQQNQRGREGSPSFHAMVLSLQCVHNPTRF